ncbi:GntR family transcriptional regulator [Luteolibacter pohnpeiensis]|uniref:GntR family transcriptional regulator n=1 Tax=Luteolibacter pohnpeiensis TaxID=454153 RepID=A0A934S9E1_9BACT|nr:GntR family transcriptional regulator [Luteolibacter pohnpeiensis]MBK1883291.1 GntR family transcriptional regulator [Luteolibacter pohnpeiensis]
MLTRTSDRIRESLEQRIIEGEFENGERLDEVRLATFYGVSRTPFREALQMLAGSGLVQLIPRRGAYVQHPGIIELVEMFEVMAELEALCGRLAARRVSKSGLKEIAKAARACEISMEKDDPDAYYRENEEFHLLIYQFSGNSFLAEEAGKLQRRLRPFRRMQLRAKGRMHQSMKEHAVILKALEAGDSEAAANAIRSHISVQGEKFHDLISTYEKVPTAK